MEEDDSILSNGELLIHGIVGDDLDGLTAKNIIQVMDRNGARDADEVTVRINSPGGQVFEGLAIYNYLAGLRARVVVKVDGLAASIASVIAMAGDQIAMPENTMLMVHRAMNIGIGNADDFRKQADDLERIDGQIVSVYARQTGMEPDRVRSLMAEETWMTAGEAVEMGFATEVIDAIEESALKRFDVDAYFRHPPECVRPAAGVAGTALQSSKKRRTAMDEEQDHKNAAPADNSAGAVNQATSAGDGAPAAADQESGAKAERDRVSAIVKRTQVANSKGANLPDDFAQRHIDAGSSVDTVQTEIINNWAAQDVGGGEQRGVNVVPGEDERQKFIEGATNWLIQKSGVANRVSRSEPSANLDPGEFRGLTMLDLARDCLERQGERTRGLGKMDLMGRAFTARNAAQTTGDFGVLLENTLHKVLLAAYRTTPVTWTRFCRTGSVSDFRPQNRYRMGLFSRLDQLTEAGEFRNKTIPDGEKEVLQAATYGNIIGLSRQAMISDDMSAFSTLAVRLGQAATRSVEIDVYNLLTSNSGSGPVMNDGKTLFHADHNNLGTGAAPSVDSFDEARTLMASQIDPAGQDFIDVRPSVWLGPLSLGGQARVVNEARYDPDDADALQKPNQVRNLFDDIVDTPRLTGTPWYAFAAPGDNAALEVGFLDGETSPFLEQEDAWRTDGMEWKVRLDYGVAAIDYRAAVKNPGA